MTLQILHCVDPCRAGWPALEAIASLQAAHSSGIAHHVVLFGNANEEQRAQRLGVTPGITLCPPGRDPALARRCAARVAPAFLAADICCAWSSRALILARRLFLADNIIGAFASAPEDGRGARALRGFPQQKYESAPVAVGMFSDESLREAWRTAGLICDESEILAPPVRADLIDLSAREKLRAELEIEPSTLALTLVGEPEEAMDASVFAFITAVMQTALKRRIVGLLSARAAQLERGKRFAQRQGEPVEIIVHANDLWDVLPAVDACVWAPTPRSVHAPSLRPAPRAGWRSVAYALQAGMPTVAPAQSGGAAALAGSPLAAIAITDEPIELARALMEKLAAREACAPAGDQQRERTQSDYATQFAQVCERVMSRSKSQRASAAG